jgi:hypothetical protein
MKAQNRLSIAKNKSLGDNKKAQIQSLGQK